MRPLLMLALLLASCAPVQTPGQPKSVRPVRIGEQFVDANSTYSRLKGCVRETASTARCDFTMVGVIGYAKGLYYASTTELVFAGGQRSVGQAIRFGTGPYAPQHEVLPFRQETSFSVRFEGIPAGATSIQSMDILSRTTLTSGTLNTTRISNVPLLPAAR